MNNLPYYFTINNGCMESKNRKQLEATVAITGGIAANYLNNEALAYARSFNCSQALIIELPQILTDTWWTSFLARLDYISIRSYYYAACMLHYEGLTLTSTNANRIYREIKSRKISDVVGWYDGPACRTIGPGNLHGVRPDVPVNVLGDFRGPSLYHYDPTLNYAVLEMNSWSQLLPWYWFSGYRNRGIKKGPIKLDHTWKIDDYKDAGLEAENGFLLCAQALRKPIIGVWLLRAPFDHRGPSYDTYMEKLRWHASGFNEQVYV